MKSIKYYMKAAERRKILSNRKEFYLDYVCRQTGWDRAKAKAEMDLYLEQGVNYRFYVKRDFGAELAKTGSEFGKYS